MKGRLMRHKLTVLFLVLTLLLNLAACGNSSNTLTDADATSQEDNFGGYEGD
jgi:predicted small lipoprotein YifL